MPYNFDIPHPIVTDSFVHAHSKAHFAEGASVYPSILNDHKRFYGHGQSPSVEQAHYSSRH